VIVEASAGTARFMVSGSPNVLTPESLVQIAGLGSNQRPLDHELLFRALSIHTLRVASRRSRQNSRAVFPQLLALDAIKRSGWNGVSIGLGVSRTISSAIKRPSSAPSVTPLCVAIIQAFAHPGMRPAIV
jgi:hypothetical protein